MLDSTLFWIAVISCIGFWMIVLLFLAEKIFYRVMNYMFEEVDLKKEVPEENE